MSVLMGKRIRTGVIGSVIAAVALLVADVARASPGDADYRVGAGDVLTIAIWRHPDLSGTFTVGSDGAVTFPLVGTISLNGRTVREVEAAVATRLAAGFVRDPQVTVSVQTYRSQRVYVAGEVRQPGAITLSGPLTVIEALARAGSVTEYASSDAIIARPADSAAAGDAGVTGSLQMIHVDIRELQGGHLAGNALLRDGDTLLVPRAPTVHVMGEVRRPGDYAIQAATTVIDVLSRAGGATDRGSIDRVRLVRMVRGKRKQLKAGLQDTLQPDDVLIVRERLF